MQELEMQMIQAMKDLVVQVQKQREEINELTDYANQLHQEMNNLLYETAGLEKDPSFYQPTFRSDAETIRLIREEGKSLARFGDGEFSLAAGVARQGFQRMDPRLSERLRQVLTEENPNCLVAIANHYGNLERFNDQTKAGIRFYLTREIRLQHRELLDLNRVYSDTYMTRVYVSFQDCFTEAPRKRFDALQTIWEGKRIMIVEGAQTRLGIGNDLFHNTKSIQRILAPPTSSFDRYDDILQCCLAYGKAVDLFLLAIGPSSGVLAFDLTKAGFQAVDVGHIDMEYEWFLAGEGKRVPVPHKYNNEMQGGNQVKEIQDEAYEAEIVGRFLENGGEE